MGFFKDGPILWIGPKDAPIQWDNCCLLNGVFRLLTSKIIIGMVRL